MPIIGDIVLVYYEGEPAFFARIEDIAPDHKPHWFHVKLLVLQVPVVEIVWTLREEYISGDSFTMEGKTIRMELVTGPRESIRHDVLDERGPENKKKNAVSGNVIPLFKVEK